MTSNLLAALKSNQAKASLANVPPLIEASKNGDIYALITTLEQGRGLQRAV